MPNNLRYKPKLQYLYKMRLYFITSLLLLGTWLYSNTQDLDSEINFATLLEKASVYQKSNLDSSDILARQCLEGATNDSNLFYIAEANHILASNHRLRNHNIEAIKHYTKALTIYNTLNLLPKAYQVKKWLGLCYANESKYDIGFQLLESCIVYYDSLNDTDSQGEVLLNLARAYKSKGDFTSALSTCNKALSLSSYINNSELNWRIRNFSGFIYYMNNKHKEALEFVMQSLEEHEKFKDNKTELYRLHFYAGCINIFMKDYQTALKNFEASLCISRSMSNKSLGEYFTGHSQMNIGNIYQKTNQFDSAKHYLNLALKNVELSKDLHSTGENYYILGELYFNKKSYDTAYYYYNLSFDIHTHNREIEPLNWTKLGIAKTLFRKNKIDKALRYLLKLYHNESQNLEIQEQSSFYISRIYKLKGEFKKSLFYLETNKKLKEELINEDKIKEIAQLEIEFEYNAKQQELELKRNSEKAILEAQIVQKELTIYLAVSGFVLALIILLFIFRSLNLRKKANQQQEVLLKEIHHRVKNNLQVISSMLNLQSRSIKDDKIKTALNESQGRVKSMALIHQMLYQQDNFSQIDIRTYISQLGKFISSSQRDLHNAVKLKTNIENLWLDIDTAVPLGLIVNELLTNCYKYAFPKKQSGEINISLNRIESNDIVLLVSDNGIGLPKDILEHKRNTTLGLNMVKILTKQLKGKLTIENKDGTCITCRISEVRKYNKH